MRLGKYIDLDVPDEVVGIKALRQIHVAGPRRQQLGAVLEGAEPAALGFSWHEIRCHGNKIGALTNCVWSYRLGKNIGFALVAADCAPGEAVEIIKEGKSIAARLTTLPFIPG